MAGNHSGSIGAERVGFLNKEGPKAIGCPLRIPVASGMPSKIIILGPFPPPLHGFSNANLAMRAKFEEAGFAVLTIDTASGAGGPAPIVSRVSAIVRLVAALVRGRFCLYLPVSGGNGQWADVAGALLARLFGRPIVLHHHSFAYLNRFSRLADFLFRASGRKARHIVLGAGMKVELARRYAAARHITVMSNASLAEIQPGDTKGIGRPFTIGFLSNITLDKGIDRFVALHAQLNANGVAAAIAGPVVEPAAQREVDRARSNGARYLGAVSGQSKAAFFKSIDVLVFPSRYANEAEPFVILEALACGTPVIASRRGCIASLIDDSCGLVLDARGDDIAPAVDLIVRWAAEPAAFEMARRAASKRFAAIRRESSKALDALIVEIEKS